MEKRYRDQLYSSVMSATYASGSNPDVSKALNTKAAAEILGFSPKTLANLRWMGGGPRFQKGPGRTGAVRYPISALIEWRDQHMRSSTSDVGGCDD